MYCAKHFVIINRCIFMHSIPDYLYISRDKYVPDFDGFFLRVFTKSNPPIIPLALIIFVKSKFALKGNVFLYAQRMKLLHLLSFLFCIFFVNQII